MADTFIEEQPVCNYFDENYYHIEEHTSRSIYCKSLTFHYSSEADILKPTPKGHV